MRPDGHGSRHHALEAEGRLSGNVRDGQYLHEIRRH